MFNFNIQGETVIDKFPKKLQQFNQARLMERFKERLINGGRLLNESDAEEVYNRTLELFRSGKYKPNPDLGGYLNMKWLDDVDSKYLKGLTELLEKRKHKREKLRMKF